MAKSKYQQIETATPGVSARVRPGTESVPNARFQQFYDVAMEFVALSELLETTTRNLKRKKGTMLTRASRVPGLVGMRSAPDNRSLLITLVNKFEWCRDLLRLSLGEEYAAVVGEKFAVEIPIIPGVMTERDLRASLREMLRSRGVSAKVTAGVLKEGKIKLDVSGRKVQALVDAGTVKLRHGARIPKPEIRIEIKPLKKSPRTKPKSKAGRKK